MVHDYLLRHTQTTDSSGSCPRGPRPRTQGVQLTHLPGAATSPASWSWSWCPPLPARPTVLISIVPPAMTGPTAQGTWLMAR